MPCLLKRSADSFGGFLSEQARSQPLELVRRDLVGELTARAVPMQGAPCNLNYRSTLMRIKRRGVLPLVTVSVICTWPTPSRAMFSVMIAGPVKGAPRVLLAISVHGSSRELAASMAMLISLRVGRRRKLSDLPKYRHPWVTQRCYCCLSIPVGLSQAALVNGKAA
jgi:hypothetical protein